MLRFLCLIALILLVLYIAFHVLMFLAPIVIFALVVYIGWKIIGSMIRKFYDSLD
ncbi:hypothetical protein [Alicyclobacillus shizuokensis]|uniref:hypothetical protein n=1 Tax=Alicyclobacillus shizuokensis TaxID=392014 RepID=UPI000A6F257C|nr:hypothetical protein [Alicyclobacillus shizuokensis]